MKVYDSTAAAAGATSARPDRPDRPATALIHDAPDARVVMFRIEPGQEVPVHTSTSSVVLFVLSGSGSVRGAEGERAVKTGDVVAYERQEPHGMRAGAERLVIAAVITPRPVAA